MDLGNLNLRALASSMSGGEGSGGKTKQNNADGVAANGGFAALIAALLTGPKTGAPAEASAPGQNLLAKAGAAPAQNLAVQEFAGSIIQVTPETVAGQAVGVEAHAANPSLLTSRGAAQPALKPVQAPGQQADKPKSASKSDADLEPLSGAKPAANAQPASTHSNAAKPAEMVKTAQHAGPQQQVAADQLSAIRPQTDFSPERSETVSRDGASGLAPASGAEGVSGRVKPHAVQQGAQSIVSQVAQQLTYAARGGMQQIRFQLHPAELGQVSVQLRIREGATKVVISADNPAAIETMRHAANALHQALQSAGMQLDREQLQFQQQGGAQFAFGDETQRDGGRGAPEDQGPMTTRNEKTEPASGPAREDGLFL